MTNRNPYENGVDIPDFVEKNDNDIDMSIFKMPSDDEPKLNINADDEYDDDDYEPRKLSQKGIVIIGIIIIVVLLIATIIGWGYGISNHKKYIAVETEYNEIQTSLTSANSQIASLNETITELQAQLQEQEEATEEAVSGTSMTVIKGVTLRTGAGVKYSKVTISKLPDDLKLLVNDNATINEGSAITVYETKADDSDRTWAKIVSDQDVWICIQEGTEKYAK